MIKHFQQLIRKIRRIDNYSGMRYDHHNHLNDLYH